MESLEVTKGMDGNAAAEFYYHRGNQEKITISELLSTDRENVKFYQEGEPVQLSNREVIQLYDAVTDVLSVEFYQGNMLVIASGEIPTEQLMVITDNMM